MAKKHSQSKRQRSRNATRPHAGMSRKPRRCSAPTRQGTPCRRLLRDGEDRCRQHGSQAKRSANHADGESVVVIGSRKDGNARRLLEETLEQAGFWKRIERERRSCRVEKSDFRVVIKPDLEFFDRDAATGTDPELVEQLILLLHRRGYRQVVVADGMGCADLWLDNRDVPVLADLAGYRYVTDDNKPYTVVNLSEEVVENVFPENTVLSGSGLGRTWLEAHFRIGVAKNKTHDEYYFSLGLQNLLSVLPLRDKDYHYRHRLDSGDVLMELMERTPVHFSIIDALVSNHGSDGIHTHNPLRTQTVIASDHLLLADWAAALKMGLDPYASPVNARALRDIGLPKRHRIQGDLTPYEGWKNVPPLLADSIRKRNRSVSIMQMVRPWLQTVNTELFPFKNGVDERMNRLIGEYVRNTDRHPAAQMISVGINYLLAGSHNLLECYEVMFDKERVRRKHSTLGLDLSQYRLSDYEAIIDYMEPLAEIAAGTPPDRNGLRWRYIDQSVLFEFRRTLPIDYDAFVKRVDIGAAVRMMNDNIGGVCVPVSEDQRHRVTHQAERDIYLPQPNWMVWFGGQFIDVGKLEFIRYEKSRQQIFWRTVASANDSATYDDGIVTFARDAEGMTAIDIVARQQFTLPLFWQVVNVDLIPQIKDSVGVKHLYRYSFRGR